MGTLIFSFRTEVPIRWTTDRQSFTSRHAKQAVFAGRMLRKQPSRMTGRHFEQGRNWGEEKKRKGKGGEGGKEGVLVKSSVL